MKHAVLADIHGNLAALLATLEAAKQFGAEHLFLLGDYVGYYYQPEAVIRALREWPHTAVLGNHDRSMIRITTASADLCRAPGDPEAGRAVDPTVLSAGSLDWLHYLEDQTVSKHGRFVVLCAHGTPRNADEYLYPDAEGDAVEACSVEGVDLVFLGHTHYPMAALTKRGTLVLNPGSVGQARDLGGFASWCLFDDESGAVRLVKTPFDAQHLWRTIQERDPDWDWGRHVLVRNNPQLRALLEHDEAAHGASAGEGGRS